MVLFGGSPHSFSHVVKSRDKITFIGVQQQQQQQCCNLWICLSQWPRVLRRRSAAARLLGLWVRIPPGAWIFVCCECCVLSGRGLCDDLITHPEESYRMWCVVVYDLETSWMRRPWSTGGCRAKNKQTNVRILFENLKWVEIGLLCA